MTTINDREWAFLAEQTGQPGPFNDMYFKYLRGLGYTGTLQDMIGQSGFGFTPSKGGPLYEPEAKALFDRFTTSPTSERKNLINNLIKSLKHEGIWTKLDALYITAAADNQAARRNWIADQYNLVAASAPVFTVDRGYQGGSSSYLETNLNPATAIGLKQSQDDATIMLWSRTVDQSNNGDIGNSGSFISPRTTNNFVNFRVNAGASSSTPNLDGSGMFCASRLSSSSVQVYRNGVAIGSAISSTSTAPESASYRVCGRSGTFTSSSIRQQAAASFGARLSPVQITAYYDAIRTYLQAIGAV